MNTMQDTELVKLLTVEEVSKLLNVSRTTLFNLKKDGLLVPLKLGAKSVRYEYHNVIQYIRTVKENSHKAA